jgi:hypothetical protein
MSPPERAQSAAASAMKPTPIAADREFTTRTDGPNSRAAIVAAL